MGDSTSSFNIYYKFECTKTIQTIQFSIEMKISYTLFLTAMIAITIERCRAEYLLVEVDDDDSRATKNDDAVRVPNNDDEIRKREIEQLNRQNICDIKPCCCDSCYPCADHIIAELRKIVEERKARETKIVPTPRECCKKAGVPAFCLGNCSPADAMARQGKRINACSKYDTIIEGCFQAAEPMRLPEPELKPIQETSDDKDGPIISHGSPTIVKPSAIPKQEQNAPASKEDPGQCIGACGGICPPCKSEPIPKVDPGQCIGVCGGICPPCKSEPIPEEDPGQCIGVCGGICPPCKSEPLPKEDPESQMQSRGQCTTPCTGNECWCGRNTCASSCC